LQTSAFAGYYSHVVQTKSSVQCSVSSILIAGRILGKILRLTMKTLVEKVDDIQKLDVANR